MADRLSKSARSENMRKIKDRDTAPELLVRRLVHGMGYRYRLHQKDLPGKPDLVFRSRRKVIFVHGCFWHQHKNCRDGRIPRSNINYWSPKLNRNVQRDAVVKLALEEMGWDAMVVWQCQTKDLNVARENIKAFLDSKGADIRQK